MKSMSKVPLKFIINMKSYLVKFKLFWSLVLIAFAKVLFYKNIKRKLELFFLNLFLYLPRNLLLDVRGRFEEGDYFYQIY